MATLNVTNLQNVASTVTNVSLLADGTTSLVLNATGTARTGGIRYNAGTLEVYNGGAWVAVGGGGGGGVSAVTASAPLVSSGGATPNLTINAATTALPGSVQLADATASKAGTSATLVNTPAFSVPKDASGMTGAAILPSGTDLQRAAIASPVAGMTRFNTDSGFGEIYTGATLGWKKLEYVAAESTTDLVYSVNTVLNDGVYLCRNLTVNAGVTLTTNGQGIVFICSGNATVNGTINVNSGGPVGGNFLAGDDLTTVSAGFGQGAGQGGASISKPYAAIISLTGSGGGSGAGLTPSGGYIQTAGGGAGGGSIVIRAFGNITLSSTGILTANGGNANTSSVLVGGSYGLAGAGGGSGGSVILHSSGNLTTQGTISVNGGNGSNGATSGYIGGAGGGGGGGGIVILQTLGTPTNTATIQRAQGTSGTGTGSVGLGIVSGGSGGAFGGAGGNSIAAPTSATQGLILNSGSPF